MTLHSKCLIASATFKSSNCVKHEHYNCTLGFVGNVWWEMLHWNVLTCEWMSMWTMSLQSKTLIASVTLGRLDFLHFVFSLKLFKSTKWAPAPGQTSLCYLINQTLKFEPRALLRRDTVPLIAAVWHSCLCGLPGILHRSRFWSKHHA